MPIRVLVYLLCFANFGFNIYFISITMTILKKIENHLKGGASLTSNDALFMFGTSRLAGAIHVLRKKYTIHTRMIIVKTRSGRMANVARYYLDFGDLPKAQREKLIDPALLKNSQSA